MKSNEYGEIIISEQEAFDALYTGKIDNLEGVYVDNTIEYNHARITNADKIPQLDIIYHDKFDSIESFDKANQLSWFMPKDYCPNLVEILYGMCITTEQKDRVSLELELFIQHNMMDLLYYLKYLVDTMRSNKIVWGVGRGSSVASYVLFLIGVHKIDSLVYQLDITEFLK